ncbi:MAG: hypothetical protein ACLQVW_30210 [Limisphaerales bacterium]
MENTVGETPTGATGTVALPRKSLMIGATHLYRTLVIDDDPCVHNVFANMLSQEFVPSARPQPAGLALPGESVPEAQFPRFEVDCAFGGEQGLEFVRKSLAHKRPYAMSFVDLRMQAGWDGMLAKTLWTHGSSSITRVR